MKKKTLQLVFQHYTSLNTPHHEVEDGVDAGATSNLDTDESEEERREEEGHLIQNQRLEIALEDEEVEAASPSKRLKVRGEIQQRNRSEPRNAPTRNMSGVIGVGPMGGPDKN